MALFLIFLALPYSMPKRQFRSPKVLAPSLPPSTFSPQFPRLMNPQMQQRPAVIPPASTILHEIWNLKNLSFLAAIVLIFFFASCSKPQAFDYRDIKNFKVETVGFDQTALSMDLVYYNPNGFGVDLRRVDCDVYVDNTYLGKFQLDTLMHIPRRAEFVLPSRIMVDMKTLLKNSLNMLFSQEVLVNVKGTTRVGKAGFFATVPFNYEARHKLNLF